MQVTDTEGKVIAAHEAGDNAVELLRGYMKNPRVASVTVGKMPIVGQEVEIGGLVYAVVGRNNKELKLKLKG